MSRREDSAEVLELRRELGRQLRAARLAADYTQPRLARRTGYSRSTVSSVESGVQNVPRAFWERCDQALGTGGALTAGFARIERQRDTERRAAERREAAALAAGRCGDDLPMPELTAGRLDADEAVRVAEAARAYERAGWPVETAGDRVDLVTGDVLDALEVPRAAGVLAARWWLFTEGAQDEVRRLPALPPPAESLAVVAAGERFLFLVQAGACPWSRAELAAHAGGHSGGASVYWHTAGGRIPVPPSVYDAGGQRVEWAYRPQNRMWLADPVILLDLLAKATAAASGASFALKMPGGVPVVPAASRDSA